MVRFIRGAFFNLVFGDENGGASFVDLSREGEGEEVEALFFGHGACRGYFFEVVLLYENC